MRTMKRISALLVLCLLVTLLVPVTCTQAKTKLKKRTKNIELYVGDTYTFTAKTVSEPDSEVATVSKSGKKYTVTAEQAGTYKITGKSKKVQTKYVITVKDLDITVEQSKSDPSVAIITNNSDKLLSEIFINYEAFDSDGNVVNRGVTSVNNVFPKQIVSVASGSNNKCNLSINSYTVDLEHTLIHDQLTYDVKETTQTLEKYIIHKPYVVVENISNEVITASIAFTYFDAAGNIIGVFITHNILSPLNVKTVYPLSDIWENTITGEKTNYEVKIYGYY